MSKLEKAVAEALRRKKELVKSDGASTRCATEADAVGSGDVLTPPVSAQNPAENVEVSTQPAPAPETDKAPDHVLLTRGTSFAASEVYGKIKSRILRMSEREPELRRLMVTSTLRNEGKSLTAVNLAISFSRSYDQSVLLIDTDLRAPTVHSYLDIENTPGLIQCLTGEASLAEAITDTGIENLKVLPSGGTVANPVELLSSARNQQLIAELSKTYKGSILIFDTPPVLPFADAHALLPNVGGVLFVVREGYPRKEQFEEALQNLDDASFIGIVFNGATRNTNWKANDGYGYGYGY